VFQSRSGFSPRRDVSKALAARPHTGFNPVLGFLPVATQRRDSAQLRRVVSIPFWVFSPSRQHTRVLGIQRVESFNPVLGFLPVATHAGLFIPLPLACFNPVLGFLPVAT